MKKDYELKVNFKVKIREGSGTALLPMDIASALRKQGCIVNIVAAEDNVAQMEVSPPRHIVTGQDVRLTNEESVTTIESLEVEAIKNAITAYGGNLTETAKALGIGRATLYRKVKQYAIDVTRYTRCP